MQIKSASPTPPEKKSKKKKFQWDGTVSFLAVAAGIVLIWAGVLGWQKLSLAHKNTELEASIARIETQIKALKQQEGVTDRQNAAEILQRAERYRIEWSRLVDALLEKEGSDVRFYRFHTSPEGSVSVTGHANSLMALTRYLEAIQKDPDVHDPFVSTLSAEEGSSALHFEMTFDLSIPSKQGKI
ncbi:MAG: hypothetical protein K9M51_00030 [Candidatus Gracilibacteria bacterium]|nr:hypothetical protein [Candidatus Gracilibacteria bacterium]